MPGPKITLVTEGSTASAVPAAALQIGGSDGTDLRAIATDTSGQVKLAATTNAIGKLAANSGVDIGDVTINNTVGGPGFVQISDGTAAFGTARNPLRVASSGLASFRAVYDDIALAQNKYLAVLFNADTALDVVIQRIWVWHANLSAVTGVISEMELLRISAFTTDTAVTPIADDPETDTLDADIDADTNSSAVSDVAGGLILRFHRTGEEMILAADNLLLSGSTYHGALIYERKDGMRGITLSGTTAANRGIAVKNITSTTEGTVNVVIEFSVEAT